MRANAARRAQPRSSMQEKKTHARSNEHTYTQAASVTSTQADTRKAKSVPSSPCSAPTPLRNIRQATRAHKTTQWPKLVHLSKFIRDSTACSSWSTRTIYKACGLLSKTPTSTPRGIGKRARAALLCARPPIMRFDSRDSRRSGGSAFSPSATRKYSRSLPGRTNGEVWRRTFDGDVVRVDTFNPLCGSLPTDCTRAQSRVLRPHCSIMD